jgi:hypothetical protein
MKKAKTPAKGLLILAAKELKAICRISTNSLPAATAY